MYVYIITLNSGIGMRKCEEFSVSTSKIKLHYKRVLPKFVEYVFGMQGITNLAKYACIQNGKTIGEEEIILYLIRNEK